MSLPTSTELLTLDYAAEGAPFVIVGGAASLDVGLEGAPFSYAASGASGMNTSSVSLPAITGDGAVDLSAFNVSGNSIDDDGDPIILPAIEGLGTGGEGAPLPAITGSGTALVGQVADSALTLSAITGSGTASPGVMGTSAASLPAMTGSGSAPPESSQILPAITGSASALVGVVGRSSLTLAAIEGEATGVVPVVGTSGASLPLPVASGSAITGNVGTSSATLAAFTLAAEGFSGAIGSSTLTLPVISGEGSGYVEVVGTSTLTLPAIVASGQAGTVVGATYSAYALNSENRALTTYSAMPIKGLAKFNGVYLAAGPGGLFVLGGDTDADALISASVTLAATDFGDPAIKRVESMYVHYRTTGDLSLNVIINEHEQYEYTLPAAGHTTLSPGRVKIGRGAKGTYWQFQIANRDGADFEFDRISVEPLATSRKVG